MLSTLQKRVSQYIEQYREKHGLAPNTWEIGVANDIDNGSVQRVLLTLQAKGFIERTPYRSRETKVIRSAGAA